MRKSDAERRAFLKSLRLKMIQIQDASDARLGSSRVPEDELDAILERTDAAWREENGIPKKRSPASA